MDAAVDSLTFTSLKTDGLHRLQRDWEKRKMITVYGGNIRYATSHFHVGLTALSYSFGKFKMDPDPKPYNLFLISEVSNNFNIGVDYMLVTVLSLWRNCPFEKRSYFYLECLAVNTRFLYIFLGIIPLLRPPLSSFVWKCFLARLYPVQNEQGVYMGLQLTAIARWKLSVYADLFRFPWLKYGIDAPSGDREYMAQIDYTLVNLFGVINTGKRKEWNF